MERVLKLVDLKAAVVLLERIGLHLLPHIKKRRLSEPQPLANKRLTNGFSKTDHVTTRAQAKNDPSARVSPARKVKHKALSSEEKRLEISMRLRHEEKNSTSANATTTNTTANPVSRKRGEANRPKTGSRRTNGVNGLEQRANKSRSKLLLPPDPDLPSIAQKVSVSQKRAREAESREARARKRRSALWVLNCEAEEFLFGETAAEEHEVELPPMSPPPKKRRRMRATELGELLKETPLLESKLRQAPTTSSCSESDDSKSLPRNYNKSEPKSESEVEEDSFELSTSMLVDTADPKDFDPSLPLAVRSQNVLKSLRWKFSFEEPPATEIWFQTFSRHDNPAGSFQSRSSPVLLPYESKSLGRSPKKARRPPRKSPRCHASTQAILSALKPTRGTRNSLSAASPPVPSVVPPPPDPPCPPPPPVPTTAATPRPSSSRSKPTASNLNRHLFRHEPAATSTASPLRGPSDLLSGTQYLWESIQFLSDPYVLGVLSGLQEGPKKVKRSKSPLSLLIPSPKTSPRLNGKRTPPPGPSSPAPATTNGHGRVKTPLSSPSSVRKSPRKSPLVLGSDAVKGKGGKASWLDLSTAREEEVLYTLPPDRLPEFEWSIFL